MNFNDVSCQPMNFALENPLLTFLIGTSFLSLVVALICLLILRRKEPSP